MRDNGDGSYRYEYVVHNRDNHGGNAELRIPICPTGTFFNAGFKDLDQNAGNDWTISRIGDEIVFAAPMGNAQPWNTLYNFWFDSDTGPGDADATIFQGTINPGANGSLTIPTDANINLGGGCGMPHVLAANGRATIPNPSLALTVDNIGPGQVTALHVNFNGNSVSLFPPLGLPTCDLLSPEFSLPGIAFGGIAFWQFPIPNTPSAEGSSIFYQVAIGQPGGAVLGIADLSNKLQLRVGNNVTGCQ